ncbi:MAG: hypothetical protein ABFQ64_07115 [Campylobacterota bacterium]
MRNAISKYFNIYVLVALIGGFSFFYLFSFAFVLNDVANGSSSQMKKEYMEKKRQLCLSDPTQC